MTTMSKAWDYSKKGMLWGGVSGAALGVAAKVVGGPFLAEMPLWALAGGGAVQWGVLGGIGGAIAGAFKKSDKDTSEPQMANVGHKTRPALEQEIGREPEQASTKYRDMVEQSRQPVNDLQIS
jgi:hypothetical protein